MGPPGCCWGLLDRSMNKGLARKSASSAISAGLFLLSVLRLLQGDDSTWMLCVPYGYTSMLKIIPEDNEEGNDRENSEKD